MRQFFESIKEYRSVARQEWRRTVSALTCEPDSIPMEMPAFFLDRYTYRMFTAAFEQEPKKVIVPDFQMEMALVAWEAAVQGSVVGLPAHGIDAPILDDLVPVSAFLEELLAMWRRYLGEKGLSLSNAFMPPHNVTWRSLFKRSVHFPKPPVIKGPTFFARLSPRQQQQILSLHGPSAALDFYIFLLQIHEESHMHQTGEPLLCELTHAWLWCNFLTEQKLWVFQRNEDTGFICNLEASWLDRLRWSSTDARAMYLDTAEAVSERMGCAIYEQACNLAALLDSRRISYQAYLSRVTELLALNHQPDR